MVNYILSLASGVIMDPEQVFSSVKKDVRSLLISSKHGLSPEQLRKDYQNMLGLPLPLKVLGFRSVLDLVKEIPDVVHLDYNLNGTVVLKGNLSVFSNIQVILKGLQLKWVLLHFYESRLHFHCCAVPKTHNMF